MRFLLLALLVAAPVSADPCRTRCRDRARACKLRCKMNHRRFDQPRHRCLQSCELHEANCRAGC